MPPARLTSMISERKTHHFYDSVQLKWRECTYIFPPDGLWDLLIDDNTKDQMALVDVVEHVPEHRSYFIALPHPLEHHDLVEVASKAADNHLQLDRGCYLAAESTIGQVTLKWIGIAVCNAAREL